MNNSRQVVLKCFFPLLQRLLSAVQKYATRGDPCSVVKAIDQFCRHTEWAMNVGDEKGTDFSLYDCVVRD